MQSKSVAITPEAASLRPGLHDAAVPANLRGRAKTGAAWTTAVSVVSRLQQMLLQVVLAWLLAPGDFGLIALAYTVLAYAWFLQHAGLGAVLLQRQKRFRLWVSPATGLVMLTGLLSTLLTLAAAWPAAAAYGQPRLAGVIAVLAISILPDALRSIAHVKLRAALQFRADCTLQLAALMLTLLLTLAFASGGFGVYSFVLPRVAVSLVMLGIEWRVAKPGVRWDRILHRWRYLISSSAWVTAAGLCIQVMNQGDYMILGLFSDEATVGHYFFAFMLSTQAMMLVTINLGGVLTPVLSRMQDRPTVQVDRFFEACSLIGLAGIPACFGLALVADPLIRVFFDDRYLPAIPFLQWLSVGMAFRMVGHNGSFLMQANGRWRAYFLLSLLNAIGFLAVCLLGVLLGGPPLLAAAVAAFYVVFGYTQLRVGTHGLGPGLTRRIAGVYAAPLLACTPGYLLIAAADAWFRPPPLLALPLWTALGALWCLAAFRVCFPDRLTHLLDQLPLQQLGFRRH